MSSSPLSSPPESPPASPPEFQLTWTDGITRKNLPKLAFCLDHLEEAYGFDCDVSNVVLVKFIRGYAEFIHQASHMATDGPSPFLDRNINVCKNVKWTDFVLFDQNMHECTSELPTFDELWDEICESFLHIDVDDDNNALNLCGHEMVHGQEVTAYEAFTFEYLQHCDVKYAELIRSILVDQPVYTDLPSDYDEYVGNRLHGRDPFFGLTNALKPFLYDDFCSHHVLALFAGDVALTVDLFKATSFTPTPAQVNILTDRMSREWTNYIGNVWNGISKAVRANMATINARGVAEALVHRCRELLQEHSPQYLAWYLYVWVFGRAVAAFGENPADSAWVKEMIRNWEQVHPDLIDHTDHPQPDYTMDMYRGYKLSRTLLEEANQLDQLEDVSFVPVGPPLQPLTYTNAIQVTDTMELCAICLCEFGTEPAVQLRVCDHVMHHDCLEQMINGVMGNANLCPLDRLEICPRRPREPAP